MTLRQTPSFVLIAVVLAAPAARAQLSQKNPFPTPTKMALVMPKSAPLPAGLADRLKAVGLDPSDPNLKGKLSSRLDGVRRGGSARPGVTKQLAPGASRWGDQALKGIPAGAAKKPPATPSSGPATSMVEGLQISPWYFRTLLRVKAPKFYAASDVTYKVAGPCGLSYGGPLVADGGPFGCCGWDSDGSELMALKTETYYPEKWALGGTGANVTVSFSAAGLPDASRTLTNVTGAPQQVKIAVTVDTAPALAGGAEAGLTASNAKLGGTGPRSSDGEPWNSTTGEDTLGLGVFLGKGYKVTETKIVAAQSKLDAPGNTAPENAYRYARVKTKPDADRLQTVVEWMYGPGESLSYTIEWTIVGPLGQRPLLTMPTSGPCDS